RLPRRRGTEGRAAVGEEQEASEPTEARRHESCDLIGADEVLPLPQHFGTQEDSAPQRSRKLPELFVVRGRRDLPQRLARARVTLQVDRHGLDERDQATKRAGERCSRQLTPLLARRRQPADALAQW